MTEKIIVLGLGNLLCGDDGFGVHVVQRLQKKYTFPENCEIIDGGTQGQILYGLLEEADKLLLIDAVNLNQEPGKLVMYGQADIPIWLSGKKLSAHQNSFAEVLALGSLKGILPKEMCLLGFQTCAIEFGTPLSALALSRLDEAEQMALNWLSRHNIRPELSSNL